MPQDHHYSARLIWSGATKGPATDYKSYSREYRVEISGKAAFAGSADPHFLGDAALVNPEDQLLAALAACHMLSYLALCTLAKITVLAYQDDATATMAHVEGNYRFTDALLQPQVVVAIGADLEKAKALHAKAHEICFIARSVNFPVRTQARVTPG